jgi:hypothetical protein
LSNPPLTDSSLALSRMALGLFDAKRAVKKQAAKRARRAA